jgi:hypothetical protein
LSHRTKTVERYLKELRENRKEKPAQVKEALDIYIDLWENAIKNKTVDPDEGIESALTKLEAKGGLYKAAGC